MKQGRGSFGPRSARFAYKREGSPGRGGPGEKNYENVWRVTLGQNGKGTTRNLDVSATHREKKKQTRKEA